MDKTNLITAVGVWICGFGMGVYFVFILISCGVIR